MATLNFNLNKFGSYCHINAFVRHQGKLQKKYTGFHIPSAVVKGTKGVSFKHWDTQKQRVKNHEDAEVINARLDEWQSRFGKYIKDCKMHGYDPQLLEIMNLLSRSAIATGPVTKETGKKRKLKVEVSSDLSFLTDAFVMFIRAMEREGVLKEKTIGKYTVVLGQIVDYELKKEKKVLLSEVNKDFYYDFADYLINDEGNVNKTILRKIKTIRTVMKYGLDELKIVHHIYFQQKIKYKDIEDPNKVPLEENERQAFWKFQTTDLYERAVCDAFLADIYLGLRFGDLTALRKVHIKDYNRTDVAFKYIDFSQEKTINSNCVPIPDFIYEIIERNMDGNGPIFVLGENGSANRILQRIAKELKLERTIVWKSMVKNELKEVEFPLHEKITFHFARYTYTRILDETTLAGRDIQKNLGHKRFATTEGYLKSDDMRRLLQTFKVVSK